MSEGRLRIGVLLSAGETAEALSASIHDLPAGRARRLGPRPFESVFYVLAGELHFESDGERVRGGPNTFFFLGSDREGMLGSRTDAATYLLLCSPAAPEDDSGKGAEADRQPRSETDASPVPRALAPVPRGANVLVRGAQSKGRIAVIDNSVGPSFDGPPLHHHDFDELFYVLEGELTFQLGEQVVRRRSGGFAFARRGSAHTWANHSGGPARVLIVCTPAGFEPFFGRMAAEREGREPPEWASRPVPETTFVGPRIPPKVQGGL